MIIFDLKVRHLLLSFTGPIDCQLSKWTKFGPWVNGKQVRTRSIIQEALYGGRKCDGKLKDTKSM